MQSITRLERLARAWQLDLRVQNKSPYTIRRYQADVGYFLRWPDCPPDPSGLTADTLRSYLLHLGENHAPATVRASLLALSLFCKFLEAEGELTSSPTQAIKAPRVPVEPQPTYTAAEIDRLLMACSRRTAEGIRDRALLLVLFSCGLRRGELTSMTMPDTEKMCFSVRGKTGHRSLPLSPRVALELDRYLRRWTISEPPLWRSIKGRKPLTGNGVLQLVRRLCKRSGVDMKGIHGFRRAFAVAFKRASIQRGIGGDSDLMALGGWRSHEMVRRYVGAESMALAHEAFRRGLDPAESLSA